jgi:hypothetical protein
MPIREAVTRSTISEAVKPEVCWSVARSGLQDKKKKLEGQLDDLWEEARKKGVEPGQLR